MKRLYLLIMTVALGLSSCHKDVFDEQSTSETTEIITVPFVFDEINGNILGLVSGEDGTLISGARVQTYSAEVLSSSFGVIDIQDLSLDVQGTLVTATKEGYLPAYDMVFPNDQGSAVVDIVMVEKRPTHSFGNETGSQISVQDIDIEIPEESMLLDNGSTFNGEVNLNVTVSGSYFNAVETNYGCGFIGTLPDKKNVNLSIPFMIDLFSFYEGGDLQLSSNKSIFIALPNQITDTNNDRLWLWNFDPISGRWIAQEKLTQNQTTVEISKTGKWAVAPYFDLSYFCTRIVDQQGNIASSQKYIAFVDGNAVGEGQSDLDGYICSKLPKGVPIVLNIYDEFCLELIDEISISPLGDVENIGDVVIDLSENVLNIKTVCSGSDSGFQKVLITNGDKIQLVQTDESGIVQISESNLFCDGSDVVTLQAISQEGNEIRSVQDVNSNVLGSDVSLEVCEIDCPLSINYEFVKLDNCEEGDYDIVNAVVEDGSGEYEFLWDDGGQGISNASLVTGELKCVTVSDTELGCSTEFCLEVPEFNTLEITNIRGANFACLYETGEILLEVNGGEEPYEFAWSESGNIVDTRQNPSELSPGVYTVTVTDALECITINSVELFDVTEAIIEDRIQHCQSTLIILEESGGFPPFTYDWSGVGIADDNTFELFTPGFYAVTVTDANECERFFTWNLILVGMNEDILLSNNTNCDRDLRILDGRADIIYTGLDQFGQQFEVTNNAGQIFVSVYESGYEFTLRGETQASCELLEPIVLPHFMGLEVVEMNTSCQGCQDGGITLEIDESAVCRDCVFGGFNVIDMDTGEVVTSLAIEHELGEGTYIVNVFDENTDCVIAHREFLIE